MKKTRGALASILAVVICTCVSPVPSAQPGPGESILPPDAVNLDIAPEDLPDAEQLQESAVAAQALLDPESFHDLLLQQKPERGPEEQVSALAILYPDVVRRAHPSSPQQVRAEAAAAHAILNPHAVPPPFAGP